MTKTYAMTRFNISLVMVSVAAFVASLAGMAAGAETTKPTPLRVAYSAISVNQAIPWISYEVGHFKKYGLDVELIHARRVDALARLASLRGSTLEAVMEQLGIAFPINA